MKRKSVNILNMVLIMVDVGAGCGNRRYSPHNPFREYNVKTKEFNSLNYIILLFTSKPFMYKRILENGVAL